MAGGQRLTVKKLEFLRRYVECGNATTAYIATYDCRGMQRKTCTEEASRLLRHNVCREWLEQHFMDTRELAGITRKHVVKRLAEFAFADPRRLYDETGNLLPVKALSRSDAAMIAGLDVEVTHMENGDAIATKKVKLRDSLAATKELAHVLGLHIVRTEDVARGGTFQIDLSD